MKVALVHYSLRRGGGMESYLADLVRGFQAAGDSVEVWARQVDKDYARELGVIAHRLLPLPLPRQIRNRVFAARIARLRLRERFPLVIALSRSRGHHVAINGGTHPGFVAATGRPGSHHDRSEKALERAMLADADTVVAHSRTLAAQIGAYYPESAAKLKVIYPPIDARRFHPPAAAARAALRAELGLRPEQVAFLFPSMDHARKGLAALLEAFTALAATDAVLLVAGRATGGSLPANVRSLGYVRDMPALYGAVDWTVLPSHYEPFGLVIAESLACGTPAIITADSGVAELMDADDGLLLADTEAATILPALREALHTVRRRPAHFVSRHGLTLQAHIAALKTCRST